MEAISSIPQYGFWFLIVLTLLVFVHELGHFLAARLCKVKVEIFSIGFGPELIGWTDRLGTRWRISMLPLGGYVRMFGQEGNPIEGEESPSPTSTEKAVAFSHKSVWQRMVIIVAGPLANYIFAGLVLFLLFMAYGKVDASPVIGTVQKGSSAESAGLKPGDRVTALNGQHIQNFEEIRRIVQLNLNQPLSIAIARGDQKLEVTAVPVIAMEKDILSKPTPVGRLGVTSAGPGEPIALSPLEAGHAAFTSLYTTSTDMLSGLWQMITGVRPTEELGGVLRIAAISGEVAKISLWSLIGFCALLSINLGLVNLFPIPMLDGGHLVYYIAEAIRGKPIPSQLQDWGLRLGVAALITLMVFATWNDLVYLNVIDYIRSFFI